MNPHQIQSNDFLSSLQSNIVLTLWTDFFSCFFFVEWKQIENTRKKQQRSKLKTTSKVMLVLKFDDLLLSVISLSYYHICVVFFLSVHCWLQRAFTTVQFSIVDGTFDTIAHHLSHGKCVIWLSFRNHFMRIIFDIYCVETKVSNCSWNLAYERMVPNTQCDKNARLVRESQPKRTHKHIYTRTNLIVNNDCTL